MVGIVSVVAVGILMPPAVPAIVAGTELVATSGGILGVGAAAGAGTTLVSGTITGAATAVTTMGTATGLAGAVAGAAVTASAGAGVTAVATSAVVGTAASGAAAGAVGSVVTGAVSTGGVAGASTVASILSGPIGWICLGLDENDFTWDCWKSVVMEPDSKIEKMTLNQVSRHRNIVNVSFDRQTSFFKFTNRKMETYSCHPVIINKKLIGYHANLCIN